MWFSWFSPAWKHACGHQRSSRLRWGLPAEQSSRFLVHFLTGNHQLPAIGCFVAGFGCAESVKSTVWGVMSWWHFTLKPLEPSELCWNRSSGTYGTQSMYKKYSWMSLKNIRGPSSRSCKWAHSCKKAVKLHRLSYFQWLINVMYDD